MRICGISITEMNLTERNQTVTLAIFHTRIPRIPFASRKRESVLQFASHSKTPLCRTILFVSKCSGGNRFIAKTKQPHKSDEEISTPLTLFNDFTLGETRKKNKGSFLFSVLIQWKMWGKMKKKKEGTSIEDGGE